MKYLCLAGGVALNCVANGRVLCEGPFDRVWIQPAVSYWVEHRRVRDPKWYFRQS